MMAHSPPPLHGPETKRPKGILKNSSSYLKSPTHKPVSVDMPVEAAFTAEPLSTTTPGSAAAGSPATEKDIVLHNTLQNAGPRRRSSSTQSRMSRRNSSAAKDDDEQASPSPRLKWDEANLYLTEQDRTPKMKINEPKTPYAKHYDPMEDEAEMSMLDASTLVVDEVDAANHPEKIAKAKGNRMRDEDIPGLELGEPEEPVAEAPKGAHSPKQVVVRDDYLGDHHHGDNGDEPQTPEEEEKHRKFEEMRKKHYEMKDVANLLGHPEYLADDDEDDDGDVSMEPNGAVPPEMPSLPAKFAGANGDNATAK